MGPGFDFCKYAPFHCPSNQGKISSFYRDHLFKTGAISKAIHLTFECGFSSHPYPTPSILSVSFPSPVPYGIFKPWVPGFFRRVLIVCAIKSARCKADVVWKSLVCSHGPTKLIAASIPLLPILNEKRHRSLR